MNDIAGRFIADQVLQKISDHSALVADITQLNFNVTYEIGFALAKEKKVVLTRHKGVTPQRPLVADVDIFDTIGYLEYENAEELESHLRKITDPSP
jgi:nucleoside 2-deoxyribosyltransferase